MKQVLAWAILLGAGSLLNASRLPVKTYTTADGLARDHILCIVQDSRGFLWFCTAEGLSRFDGYQFTSYRTEQGLPSNVIQDFVETRYHDYWVATSGGLCRFNPDGREPSRFYCLPVTGNHGIPTPSVLYSDGDGGVWAGGLDSLYHRGPKDANFRGVELSTPPKTIVTALLMDRRGTLWAGTSNGLYRRDPNGDSRIYTKADGFSNDYVMALAQDHAGRLWVGTRSGLIVMDQVAAPGQALAAKPKVRVFLMKDGLPAPRIESLLVTSEGKLWAGTTEGIAEQNSSNAPGQQPFRSYTRAQGLSAHAVGALAEDRDGNLWMGTFGSGAMKLAHSGFETYAENDGVPSVGAVLETREGELCALSRSESDLMILRFDGHRFASYRPAWPKEVTYFGWGRGSIALQDEEGEWWIATGQGLARFPPVKHLEHLTHTRPKAVYRVRDGLAGDGIFQIFEDSRRDIWIGTIGPNTEDGLARWQRSTGSITRFSETDGLPAHPVPTAFTEDRSGAVWVGLFHGGLARFQPAAGCFRTFTAKDGIPGGVRTLFPDSAGRLWIGTSQGLLRLDDPTEDPPHFLVYTTAQGLSSNFIAAITEDRGGRIYAATGRGIDGFRPGSATLGRIRHFTAADGIAAGELDLAFGDRHGALWFTTPLGISRLLPTDDAPRAPPPVLLTSLDIGGVPHPISGLGETAVEGLRLRQTPLRVGFVGLDFSPGEALRYEYMLDGADRDWNPPTDQRSVVYASLAPGSYRFQVRAVSSDGAVSPQAATLSFTILPPVWRTWWFLALSGLLATLTVVALHRYRVAHLLAVANVRTRIATDLHDDIGASLSQIAILSEVARRTEGNDSARTETALTGIATISRELVDSMSDIVWAINPDHDRLANLVYRMRRFASDLLDGRGIVLQFLSTITDQNLRTGPVVRREVYLIFKEAVHNVVRHSGASRLEVNLDLADDKLSLRLMDDGRGFDPDVQYEGRGLINMRRRAAALGGTLEFESKPGMNILRFQAPLNRQRRWLR